MTTSNSNSNLVPVVPGMILNGNPFFMFSNMRHDKRAVNTETYYGSFNKGELPCSICINYEISFEVVESGYKVLTVEATYHSVMNRDCKVKHPYTLKVDKRNVI